MIYELYNILKRYEWGRTDNIISNFITNKHTIQSSNSDDIKSNLEAELWIGAYNNLTSSYYYNDNQEKVSLYDAIQKNPHYYLGNWNTELYKKQLSILIKLISPLYNLSLQVHPSQHIAFDKYNTQTKNKKKIKLYNDIYGKPELLYTLSPFYLFAHWMLEDQQIETTISLLFCLAGIYIAYDPKVNDIVINASEILSYNNITLYNQEIIRSCMMHIPDIYNIFTNNATNYNNNNYCKYDNNTNCINSSDYQNSIPVNIYCKKQYNLLLEKNNHIIPTVNNIGQISKLITNMSDELYSNIIQHILMFYSNLFFEYPVNKKITKDKHQNTQKIIFDINNNLKKFYQDKFNTLQFINNLDKHINNKNSENSTILNPIFTLLYLMDILLKYSLYDRSFLLLLFTNFFHVKKKEYFIIPAGTPHMYVNGFGIEIMDASDNTLRYGLSTKNINIQESEQLFNYNIYTQQNILCKNFINNNKPIWIDNIKEENSNKQLPIYNYLNFNNLYENQIKGVAENLPHFQLIDVLYPHLNTNLEYASITYQSKGSILFIIVYSNSIKISYNNKNILHLKQGSAAFIPAYDTQQYSILPFSNTGCGFIMVRPYVADKELI